MGLRPGLRAGSLEGSRGSPDKAGGLTGWVAGLGVPRCAPQPSVLELSNFSIRRFLLADVRAYPLRLEPDRRTV